MKYGQELLDELKAQLAEHEKTSRADQLRRFDEQLDDCSEIINSRVDTYTTDLLQAKILILENKGLYSFSVWFDSNHKEADIKWVNTKFGGAFMIKNGETVSFTSSIKKLNALGYHQEDKKMPAWVAFSSNGGSGFAGLLTMGINYFQSRINYWTGK